MKCTSEDEVVVAGQLVQPIREVFLVDQATCFVDYHQGEDDPAISTNQPCPNLNLEYRSKEGKMYILKSATRGVDTAEC